MKKLYQNISLSVLIISLILSLSACGKKNNDISDYGTEVVASKEDADDEAGMSDEYGSLSDKLGTDKINWQESFDNGGINYKINLMYDVENQDKIPIYTINTLSDTEKKERELLINIFGENYEEVHTNLEDDDSEVASIVHRCLFEEGEPYINVNGDNEIYSGEKYYNSWSEYEGFYLHTYKGIYDEKEYYVVISKHTDPDYIILRMTPKKMSDFMDDDRITSNYSFPGENSYNLENVCKDSKDDCYQVAMDFLVTKLDKNRMLYDTDEELYYYSDIDKTVSDIVAIDGYGFEIGENIIENEIICDGSVIDELIDHEPQCINVSSKGINYICIRVLYDSLDISTDNASMLDAESLLEIFKKQIIDNLDLTDTTIKRVSFDGLFFRYYPIPNPENKDEVTLIPVWCLNSNTLSLRIIVNAIDGSLVFINN